MIHDWIRTVRRALAGPHPTALRIVGDVTFFFLFFFVATKAMAFEVRVDSTTVTPVLFGALATFTIGLYWFKRKEQGTLLARIAEMEKQMGIVTSQVVPITAAFQAMIVKDLTHAHTPELDGLMEKIGPPSTLTADEQKRFLVLLDQRMNDKSLLVPESEREKAKMLPLVMKMAEAEARAIEHPAVVRFVAAPASAVASLPSAVTQKKTEEKSKGA